MRKRTCCYLLQTGPLVPLMALFFAALLTSGCSSSESTVPADTSASDLPMESGHEDMVPETARRIPVGAGCKNVGYPFDGVNGEDSCFDPPEHYCSGGGGWMFTNFCSPDFSTCCLYPTTCGPCGWTVCSYCVDDDGDVVACPGDHHLGSDESPDCQDAPPALLDEPACPVIDSTVAVCLDDLP
jgi:hypothetical protein